PCNSHQLWVFGQRFLRGSSVNDHRHSRSFREGPLKGAITTALRLVVVVVLNVLVDVSLSRPLAPLEREALPVTRARRAPADVGFSESCVEEHRIESAPVNADLRGRIIRGPVIREEPLERCAVELAL